MVLTIINKMGDKKRKGEGHRARLGAVDHLGLASTLMLYENVALATKKKSHILGLVCCLFKKYADFATHRESSEGAPDKASHHIPATRQ